MWWPMRQATSDNSSAAFPSVSFYPHPPTTTMSNTDPYELRTKYYTRFRILVIGRANAGKTTLLKRVCNTTDDPCIYDENNKNLVCVHYEAWRWILLLTISTSLSLPQGYSIYFRYLLVSLSYPYSEGYMTSIGHSHSRATPNLSSTILLDLREATRSNWRKSYRLWKRKQSRLK